jgi:hypothetical protein
MAIWIGKEKEMMILSNFLSGVRKNISREELLQNLKRYGGGIVRMVSVKLPDLEEPPGTDECILSNTAPITSESNGKRISRDELFRKSGDRFSKLIIPSAEPVLSAEDWLKSIRKWGSVDRDEMNELMIELQEGQETDREIILKTVRYYKLNFPFAKLSAIYDAKGRLRSNRSRQLPKHQVLVLVGFFFKCKGVSSEFPSR